MSWSTGEKVAFGIIVVIIIVFIGLVLYDSTKAETLPIPLPASTGTSTSTSTTKIAIKYIDFVKDNTLNIASNAANPENWVSFQIGEVKLYDKNSDFIPHNAFKSIEYSPSGAQYLYWGADNLYDGDIGSFTHTTGSEPIQKITLTLNTPTPLSKVTVYNRQDCCQARLNGVVMNLYNENKTLISSTVLNSALVQEYTIVK